MTTEYIYWHEGLSIQSWMVCFFLFIMYVNKVYKFLDVLKLYKKSLLYFDS